MKTVKDIDPSILFSLVNTKLRDGVPSLERLCELMDWDLEELRSRLEASGYRFDATQNRWVRI